MNRRHRTLVAATLTLVGTQSALAQSISAPRTTESRIKALLDTNELERFYSIYGYQQDKSLYFENIELFVERGAAAVFQNAEYRGKDGLARFWFGHWGHLTHGAYAPVDGLMNDHLLFQPIVTLSPDGQTARLRGHGRGYITSYQGQIRVGQNTESFTDKVVDEDGVQRSAGPLALVQDYIYEHSFAKEDGAWKLRRWTLCIYATGKYGRGYADLPIPGTMGNDTNAKHGDRRAMDMESERPERPQALFPDNPTGPDHVLSAAETGCFVAKNQVMARSAVVPFSFVNPVTGRQVTWSNR